MKTFPLLSLIIIMTIVFGGCDKISEQAAVAPTVTAQGFTIDTTQEGEVNGFGSLRVRIEAPAGIEKLQITERSYDVDLATTPERNHFQLFGLDRRVLLNKDVTLDFREYINNKLKQPGEYTFVIRVTDKKSKDPVEANIVIRLMESAAEPGPESSTQPEIQEQQPLSKTTDESPHVKTGLFEIRRIGPHEIQGDETFGLTWKTIDAIHVTIRVRKKEPGASKLASLSINDYESVDTQASLEQMLAFADGQEYIDFDTANNSAFGEVLGVINSDKFYLLKSSQSDTSLSDRGTTVTLKGEYKYH